MKEYNYCPYCGEKLHTFEVKTCRGIDEIDEKILDEKELVLIDLKNESMRIPFSIYNKENKHNFEIEQMDKKRQELVNALKKCKEVCKDV